MYDIMVFWECFAVRRERGKGNKKIKGEKNALCVLILNKVTDASTTHAS